ncbi:MAG: hypothetical protein AAFX80_24650 [Cyanobacteria bacterium J06639_18]
MKVDWEVSVIRSQNSEVRSQKLGSSAEFFSWEALKLRGQAGGDRPK